MSPPRRRLVVDQVPKLDANTLERGGFFTSGTESRWEYLTNSPLGVGVRAEPYHVVITIGGVATTVALDRQARHLGGTQTYFACPRCGRCRQHLYIVRGRLGCRRCFRLRWRSHSEWRNPKPCQVAKLRARLGAEPGIGGAPPPRPRMVRRDYYARWLAKLAAVEAEALSAFRANITALERERKRRHA
jgi:hypothetical protein